MPRGLFGLRKEHSCVTDLPEDFVFIMHMSNARLRLAGCLRMKTVTLPSRSAGKHNSIASEVASAPKTA